MASIATNFQVAPQFRPWIAPGAVAFWLFVYIVVVHHPVVIYLLFISLFMIFARPSNGVAALVGVATVFALLAPILPPWLVRLPDAVIPPLAGWLDIGFNFLREDLGLTKLTRFFSQRLEFQE